MSIREPISTAASDVGPFRNIAYCVQTKILSITYGRTTELVNNPAGRNIFDSARTCETKNMFIAIRGLAGSEFFYKLAYVRGHFSVCLGAQAPRAMGPTLRLNHGVGRLRRYHLLAAELKCSASTEFSWATLLVLFKRRRMLSLIKKLR